ncbi:unnamed protein product [Ceratitis capitata]|uniref:(Mediterranean fruit fly) hypothetical protein n=1 Tax=Ceratitis capitata TaxID=7213 RepID=A0A811VAS7_CERCA|nr:unnamed protein product [Ceratitis capitata]
MCEARVHVVSTPLNLPLFIAGISSQAPKPRTDLHIRKVSRDLADPKPWQMPPNAYNTSEVPFRKRRGHFGSYWRKLPRPVIKLFEPVSVQLKKGRPKQGQWKFYDISAKANNLLGLKNKHKGVFLTNARDRPATARCMINSLSSAQRRISDPAPTHYSSPLHEFTYNISPPIIKPRPNPHLFLRHTTVPDKCLPLIRRHTSFEPAVGRYEVRYTRLCGCGRKILTPGLRLMVDREKRFKFRRLPYRKISIRRRCSPDWSHVAGRGFRRLFRTPTGKPINMNKTLAKEKPKADKLTKQIVGYPDSKYIKMINTPRKEPISSRATAAYNKKIAFSSGTERFPELEIRHVQLTVRQLEKLKASLPPERRLHDHPTMTKSLTEIRSHLYDTPPAHMRPAYEQPLRKKAFKFKPLPERKVLVTKDLLRPSAAETLYFYNQPVNPDDFLKDRIRQSVYNKWGTLAVMLPT